MSDMKTSQSTMESHGRTYTISIAEGGMKWIVDVKEQERYIGGAHGLATEELAKKAARALVKLDDWKHVT